MTISYADFIAAFPEFSNATTFPQTQIGFWIPQGYAQLNAQRFGAQIDLAVMLFVAHNVTMGARDARAAAAAGGAGIPGQASGPIASKQVDKVSASYSTGDVSYKDAGAWNYTIYGQRLYAMMRAYTSGPMYVPGRARRFGGPVFR